MTAAFYEPSPLEIGLTLGLGLTVLSPYYQDFARSLDLKGDERVLDFGSGSGVCSRHIAARLQEEGHLDCVDISEGWMRVIRRTLRRFDNVSFHLGHITQLDLRESSVDGIVMHFVLHDIPTEERATVMQSLSRKLNQQGRLIVREPQGQGLTLDEIQNLVDQAGLRIVNLRPRKTAIGQVYDGCFQRKQFVTTQIIR